MSDRDLIFEVNGDNKNIREFIYNWKEFLEIQKTKKLDEGFIKFLEYFGFKEISINGMTADAVFDGKKYYGLHLENILENEFVEDEKVELDLVYSFSVNFDTRCRF